MRPSVEEVKASVEDFIKSKCEDPDSRFSADEVTDIRRRLSELEAKFEELLSQEQITKAEFSKVSQDISTASRDVERHKKGVWYRVALPKILLTIKNIATSKEGREVIASLVRKQLGLD